MQAPNIRGWTNMTTPFCDHFMNFVLRMRKK